MSENFGDDLEPVHVQKKRRVPISETPALPPEFSESALAQRFVDRHQAHSRFVAKWGQWLRYDGSRWAREETLRAFDDAHAICREAASSCSSVKEGAAVASAKTVAAVEKLAKADRKIAATTDQWDADPWSLNTPSGTVDLTSGAIRTHDPSHYLTAITTASPTGDCPLWRKFLNRVTAGDEELETYLQRVVGYSLTGDISEHALFFGHGTGQNGKSVFVDTIAGMLGDYHRTAPIEAFTASQTDRHPTELAGLRGARLVTAVETEEGRRWAESRIKALTGGDRISVRFMRQDFFEFTPQFKLVIAGNHKPGLRSVDEAIRRRFHLIPFTVTIPADERDGKLKDRLKEEWDGILAWAIEGCLEWQLRGLQPPAAVREATSAYLEAEDSLAAWVAERCAREQNAWERSSDLFAAWRKWADRAGEPAGTLKRFSQNLEAHGFTWQRRRDGRGFIGLKLIQLMTGAEV